MFTVLSKKSFTPTNKSLMSPTINFWSEDSSGLIPGLHFSINFRVALLLVCFQVSYPSKSSATHPTAVRFLPSVDSLVFPQVSCLREHLPTCRAAERLLPGVNTLMDLHLLWPVKSFSTVAADKQSLLGATSMVHFGAIIEGLGQLERGAVMSPVINTGRG